MKEGIIFDFDGVLVHTERSTFEFYKELLPKYGFFLKDEDFKYKAGRKSVDFFRDVLGEKFDADFVSDITNQKRRAFSDDVRRYVTLIDGARETLAFCKDLGLRIGLGSQNERFFIDKVLEEFELTVFFDTTVSLQDVANKKPNPEIFLKAAKALNVSPKNSIVVEDAPEGLEAAKIGGFYAVGITTSHPKEVLHDADVILASVQELQNDEYRDMFLS